MGERHLLPPCDDCASDADVDIDNDLEIRVGETIVKIADGVDGIFLYDDGGRRDVTHDVVGSALKPTGLSADLMYALVGRWLASLHGGSPVDALARRLRELFPGLDRLHHHYQQLIRRDHFSVREAAYLRAESLSDGASAYWGDHCGDAAGRALLKAVLVTFPTNATAPRLSEDRIGMMHLIHDPALRLEVASASVVPSLVVPLLNSRIVTTRLKGRAQVDFVLEALQRPESRQMIHIAHRLGIEASGTNGRDAYHQLAHDVRTAGYRRPNRVIDRFAARPIEGRTVQVVDTASETRRIGRVAENCLRNEQYGWPQRVEVGAAQLAVLFNGNTIEAVLALSSDGSQGLELRGPKNREVSIELQKAIYSRLSEVTGTDYPMPAHIAANQGEPPAEPW